jgi:hypothetical protein
MRSGRRRKKVIKKSIAKVRRLQGKETKTGGRKDSKEVIKENYQRKE